MRTSVFVICPKCENKNNIWLISNRIEDRLNPPECDLCGGFGLLERITSIKYKRIEND